jgi:hypothetical protein
MAGLKEMTDTHTIHRRRFITGVSAAILSGCARKEDMARSPKPFDFRPYRAGQTLAPVTCVTPDDGFYIHTFFDVCPWSPSQRYLACLKLPFQDRKPVHGDTADVCVIDLEDRTIRTVYTTRAFGMQTGSQVQWGTTDQYVYCNDLSDAADGHAVCVQIDWQAGTNRELEGPLYHLSPDGSKAISFNLDLINHVQDGYGCVVAPDKRLKLPAGASETQGLWETDIASGRKKLLVSLAQIYEALPGKDDYAGLAFHLFHSKFNPQGTRIMQVVRAREPEAEEGRYRRGVLTTFNADGSDIRVAIPHELWSKGGHHPNWYPDGEELLMNLRGDEPVMRFYRFRSDGADLRRVSTKILGSGHPAYEKTGRYIFTDAYPNEPVALENGEVPMRLIDTKEDREQTVATIFTLGTGLAVLRLDPHPAWSRDGKQSCFNGSPDGRRQVFVADLSGLTESSS